MKTLVRDARLNLRLTSAQKLRLEEAARVVETEVSELARQALVRESNRILRTRRAA